MSNDLRDKLSKDAITIVEALGNEYKDDLIENAYNGLLMSGKPTGTITAKDILKYHGLHSEEHKSKTTLSDLKKRRWYYLIAFTGILYCFSGLVIYLIMNKGTSIFEHSITNQITFLMVIIGLFTTIFSIFFERYTSLRNQEREFDSVTPVVEDIEWEIVRKWTRIENTASEVIKSEIKNTSSMLKWLTNESPLSIDLKTNLKKLLTLRNQIVHGKPVEISKSELKELNDNADHIIDELVKLKS